MIKFLTVKNTIIKHSMNWKIVMYFVIATRYFFRGTALTGTKSCQFVWSKTPGQNTGMDAS